MRTIGSVLRQLRQSVGHETPESFASKIGCSVNEIKAIECDIRLPRPGEITAWANEVRLQPEMLIYLCMTTWARYMHNAIRSDVPPFEWPVKPSLEELNALSRDRGQNTSAYY